MKGERVAIVGAGIGGQVAALLLAARGLDVTVLERASAPGGKLREVAVAGRPVDSGPTVFTMRSVFEEVLDEAGESLAAHLDLEPLETLARHAWSESERLDLFTDRARSAEAISDFSGPAEGRRYLAFCDQTRRMYATLERTFIHAPRTTPFGLVARTRDSVGLQGLRHIKPFGTMWRSLESCFTDARLRQLFGRYATYCGSSPYLAPATLMLVAHVEQQGVWRVRGGMHRLARMLQHVGETRGARYRFGAGVAEVEVRGARVCAVHLDSGERVACDAVVCNADVAAIAAGRLGKQLCRALGPTKSAQRSLSAVTWSMAATAHGFPLSHHNVFFSRDYAAEFQDIFGRRRLPGEPTVYVCAQDRSDGNVAAHAGERLFCLVNAPPTGDTHGFDDEEMEQCERRMLKVLERCGLTVKATPGGSVRTTPAEFERLFPATGGALYGRASHGWQASFSRPGSRSRIAGLYLAGGSTHPGPGLPMAAISGRLAAERLLSDLGSTATSSRVAMPGGMSTP